MTLTEHRAAARIAWRHAARAKARTALVVVLVALPIMALTGAGFVINSALRSPEQRVADELGSADLGITYYSQDLTVEEIAKEVPPGSIVATSRNLNFTRIIDGGPYGVNVMDTTTPADRAPYRPRYAVRKGRMAHAPGEVALHPRLAKIFDVGIGDELAIDELDLRLRVVGFAVRREELRNLIMLAGPHTLDAHARETAAKDSSARGGSDVFPTDWLIALPPGADPDAVAGRVNSLPLEGRFGFYTRDSVLGRYRHERLLFTGAAFGGAVGALFGTGLIAAAAFGVGARRQQRTLGLVGAAGGEPRHARAIVLWGGTVLGAVGSAIGVALAIVVAYALTPHIDELVGRIIGGVRLPWLIIVGGVTLGTVAATVAALGPARQAAKLPTVDALAGRTVKPRPPGKLARRGLAAVVVGSALLAAGTATRQEKVLGAGFVIALIGFLLAIPLVVTWVGRLPARMPTSLRLAARQTSRYGRRTGPVVAAATLALTAPVALAAYTMSDEAYNDQRIPIRDDQLLLGGYNDKDPNSPLSDEVMAAARDAVRGAVVAPIRMAVGTPDGPEAARVDAEPWYVRGPDYEVLPGVYAADTFALGIGDADVLRAVDAESAIPALERGSVVAVGLRVEEGHVKIGPPNVNDRGGIEVPAVAVGRGKRLNEGDIPRYFISERAAARLGLRPGVVANGLLRGSHPLTKEEIARVTRAVSVFPGAYATSRSNYMVRFSTPARLLITGGAMILALILVAVSVALASAESRRDHAVVVAVGAGPGIRRRVVAANAFLVTALAGMVAVPAGFVPVAIVKAAATESQPIVVPWSVIGIVAVGAPFLAGLIAGAFSREPTSRALLQPVW